MEVEKIIENYSNMATIQLVALVTDIDQLRKDIVPHLRTELVNRKEFESVEIIDEFLIESKNDKPIPARVVKPTQKEIIKFIINSRSENKNEVEINIGLADKYALNSDEIKNIKTKAKKRGTILRVLAIVFLALLIYRLVDMYLIIDSGSVQRRGPDLSLGLSFVRIILYVILVSKFYITSSLLLRNSTNN